MIGSREQSAARAVVPAALILLAGWLVYWPSIHGGWVWDDTEEVTLNPVLRDPAGLGKIWFSPAGADYFPLKTTVQWFEWRLWGADPAGYHAVSIALHILSAFLFWRVLAKLGLRLAWVGGLLFVVHPVAVESVAWIAELKNTLSLPLLLFAMLAYIEFDKRGSDPKSLNPGAPFYLLSLFAFLLAMLAKSSVVMFPIVILLYCAWKRGRVDRKDLAASAPFFGIGLGLGFATLWFQHHRAIVAGHVVAGGIFTRIVCAGTSILFYLWKCLWPAGLLPIYPRWQIDPASPLQYLPWVVVIALAGILWSRRDTWGRHVLFGLGFFAINLLPVLGLVAMSYQRMSWVADHFAYISLLGVIALAVGGLDQLTASRTQGIAIAAGLGAAVAIAALAWQSRQYAEIFHDDEALWTYTVERNPDAWAAQGNLGYALFQEGRVPESIPYYREALRLNPDYAEARYNLGTSLLQMNQVGEAIAEYERAVLLQPASGGMQNNLGTALVRAGRLPEAVGHFEQAVQLEPDNAEAHHNLGNAMLLTGRLAEAIRQYEEALRLSPDDSAAKSGLEMAERALQSGK
jgi:tetratricopeptide (TPR) repeat protein